MCVRTQWVSDQVSKQANKSQGQEKLCALVCYCMCVYVLFDTQEEFKNTVIMTVSLRKRGCDMYVNLYVLY